MKQPHKDPYYYPGTNVLRNHLDIRDSKLLVLQEEFFTGLRNREYYSAPPKPPHDLANLLTINRRLFGDIYPFAGEFRKYTGRMTKTRASGTQVLYCDSQYVPGQIADVFRKLAAANHLTGLDADAFCRQAGYFYGELDAVHPFREGNSRTLRLFFFGLARTAGFDLSWDLVAASEGGRDKLYAARDRAVMTGDSAPLAGLFRSICTPL